VSTARLESLPPSVLLVEPSGESREVLATALKLRGLRIFEANEPHRGLELAREQHPDVIVLDFDQPAIDEALRVNLDRATRTPHAGLIMLGQAPPNRKSSGECYFAKPFHYGPLVQTIERLAGNAKAA
jgi:CheY-like chemotaxis protein